MLGAEFLAATGGDKTAFGTADRLAGFGGVAPASRDSGKISGNLRQPRRHNRRLKRVFCVSALFSIRHCEDSRRFYERKRAEGKRHIQAVLALARRRVNVLRALLPDGLTDEVTPPTACAARVITGLMPLARTAGRYTAPVGGGRFRRARLLGAACQSQHRHVVVVGSAGPVCHVLEESLQQ